jgi:hypothetical protein
MNGGDVNWTSSSYISTGGDLLSLYTSCYIFLRHLCPTNNTTRNLFITCGFSCENGQKIPAEFPADLGSQLKPS